MKQQTQKTKSIALMGMLCALLLLMAYTPLGYLRNGSVSISFLMIPVALGGIALGPTAGAILGTIFGITSFAQCFGSDAFGSLLLDINPFATFLMCIVARALAGFLAGLVASFFKNLRRKSLEKNSEAGGKQVALGVSGYAVTGLCAALLNTLLFMTTLIIFFWGSTTFIDTMNEWGIATSSIFALFAAIVTTNGILEAIAAFFITGAIASALYKAGLIDKDLSKKAGKQIEEASEDKETETAEA